MFTTKFNDSSILITIISCDYLNLSLADEHVGDVTIPTQVIEYNQNFLQSDQPIRLEQSNQIKLYSNIRHLGSTEYTSKGCKDIYYSRITSTIYLYFRIKYSGWYPFFFLLVDIVMLHIHIGNSCINEETQTLYFILSFILI